MADLQVITLLSAGLGVAGTMILFFATYSAQPPEDGIVGSQGIAEHNRAIDDKYRRRRKRQRLGLLLLCLSFLVQATGAFLPMQTLPAFQIPADMGEG